MSFRPLGYSESICAELYDRGGAGAIRSMTLVAGTLAGDQARAAIRAIRRRHPMLDMRIGFAGQRFHFVHDKLETPDPVEIRDWGPDADPDAVLAESDQLHFGASDLPYVSSSCSIRLAC
jgi:hypothetical protein